MRRIAFRALTLGAVVFTTACSNEPSGPGLPIPITLNVCATLLPDWVAYKNEGGEWTQLTPDANADVSFEATPKVSFARFIDFGGNRFTQVLNVSAAELDAVDGFECDLPAGSGTLGGSVVGLTGQEYARVSASDFTLGRAAGDPAFTITGLPDSPRDVIATRWPTVNSSPASRIIVRRAVAPGTTMAPFDFTAPEALPLANATLTLVNASSGTLALDVDVFTATGTEHRLMQATLSGGGPGGVVYVGVPASLRAATDVHRLLVSTIDPVGARQILHFYETPTNRTLTFGPAVSEPVFFGGSSSPYFQPRSDLASQPEYPSAAQMTYFQTLLSGARTMSVTTTAAFLGGRPTTWRLDIPNMSAAGFLPAWGLVGTAAYGYTAIAYNGSVMTQFGAAGAVGSTLMMASRTGEP